MKLLFPLSYRDLEEMMNMRRASVEGALRFYQGCVTFNY